MSPQAQAPQVADGDQPHEEEQKPPFPTKQLTILAICRFSEPIAFNSILAYSYIMVQELNGGDDKDASFYSGLLVSAYAVAEAITAMGWGILSDKWGRKPIVLFGLVGVAISSLIFGLARSYWVALVARCIGGALNGNVSVMQTMVAEMVKHPDHEPRAYASQPFVWTLGGIIGSAMGGFLAQPAKFYPSIFPEDGLFGQYPFLLPNLVSVGVIIVAVVQGIFFLEETNPPELRHDHRNDSPVKDNETNNNSQEHVQEEEDDVAADETTGLLSSRQQRQTTRPSLSTQPTLVDDAFPAPDAATAKAGSSSSSSSIRNGSNNKNNNNNNNESEKTKSQSAFNFTSIMVIIALVLTSYHQMAFGTLLPVHLLAKPRAPPGEVDLRGGLGYTVHDVGKYLAVQGFLGLFIQGVLFPVFVRHVGVWRSFVTMTILYPTAYVFMPFLSAVPKSLEAPGIYLSMVLQTFFGIVCVPCALILIKDATPSPRVLGKVNGLAMAGCCLARTISPPLAGIIFSAGGSAAAWLSCCGFALVGVAHLFWVPRRHVFATAENAEDEEVGGERQQAAAAAAGGHRLKSTTGDGLGGPMVRSEEVTAEEREASN